METAIFNSAAYNTPLVFYAFINSFWELLHLTELVDWSNVAGFNGMKAT